MSNCQKVSPAGLVFEPNPGDTWAFTIIGDRLPIAVMIVLIYFGVTRFHPVLGLTMMAAMLAVVVWTSPNRWGAGVALHYLSRMYWLDPADPIPPPEVSIARRIVPSADAPEDSGDHAITTRA